MKLVMLLVIIGLFSVLTAHANVSLPHIFADHMVLQQGKPITVWGLADPDEKISVTFAGKSQRTIADEKGNWQVKLKSMKAKKNQIGQKFVVTGKNEITFDDVLLGEVWVCSGQSNMQFGVGGVNNATEEIATADFPQIRLFSVPNVTAVFPQYDVNANWQICSPQTVSPFSAVGYFFGRYLHKELQVPVGLINTSWGGTICEAWTSAEALRANLPEFTTALDAITNLSGNMINSIDDYNKKQLQRQKAFQIMYDMEDDLVSAGKYAAVDFDDHDWKTTTLPGNWEANGFPDLDGIVWYRKTIDIPEEWAGKEIVLRPGPIDEVDDCWFNGTYIDGKGRMRTNETSFWNQPREYKVPGKLVKAGRNVIALRVFDATGQGGPWGGKVENMLVQLIQDETAKTIPLAGNWLIYPELILPPAPQNPAGPNYPSVLFNAMIAPLTPYAIQGAIWYQGESNADRPTQYQKLLPTMISDWRDQWQSGDFTFLIVQLANFMTRTNAPVESGWAELREAQTMATTKLPKVGLASAIDIGDAGDIHPRNKQDVGLRLGYAALSIAYKKRLPFSGPVFKSMKIKNNQVEVSYKYTDGGLIVKGDSLKGFAICAADKKFVHAKAVVVGTKVILSAEGISDPVAVRYGWGNNPDCNLYNGAHLPAVSFRTDIE